MTAAAIRLHPALPPPSVAMATSRLQLAVSDPAHAAAAIAGTARPDHWLHKGYARLVRERLGDE